MSKTSDHLSNSAPTLRILFVSHTYAVGIDQGKLNASAAMDTVEVGLLAPSNWKALEWNCPLPLETPDSTIRRIHDTNQWALTTVTAAHFQRFVRHDLQNFALLTQKAVELGYDVHSDLEQCSLGRLWSRIISSRLEPQKHLVSIDRSLDLIYRGIRSLWKYSDFVWQKRLFYSLWFIWVGLMQLFLAEPAMTWLYAPHHRSKLVNWTVTRIQALIRLNHLARGMLNRFLKGR